MARKRQNPVKEGAAGRAGNYTAPIDTVGMDESMKRTLMPKKPAKKKGFIGRIKDAMGIKY